MLARSQKALLANLIDYAGLFPPAALSMEEAVRNYARYREGEHAWMLGRFVVPEARAHEVPEDFPKSVLGVDEMTVAQRSVAQSGWAGRWRFSFLREFRTTVRLRASSLLIADPNFHMSQFLIYCYSKRLIYAG